MSLWNRRNVMPHLTKCAIVRVEFYSKGVMVEQNLENKTFSDDKTPAFTALADDGVTIWGYKYSETTGISQTLSDNIRQNGAIYDMQGRRVNNPQRKGIYIQNGKKYIVK